MRISLELIHRDHISLNNDLICVEENFPQIDTINIPDLLKFKERSWEGCAYAQNHFKKTIPHIRAIDFDTNKPFPLKELFLTNNINEVLVVRGDLPQDTTKIIYPTSSTDLIKQIKREMPSIRVYGALDPYRYGFKEEIDYAERKIDVGATGFFTQPFYDMNLLKIYADRFRDNVFYGISPVISERSRSYWEARNRIVFPSSFEFTFDYNIFLGREILNFCEENNLNTYIMPIALNIKKYLESLF